ncbi:MAG: ribonuclease P protein component [Prevotella sp.]|nr:ribonuclease P protein component [Prevotella sp.]
MVSQKAIDQLFEKGKSRALTAYPLRIVYQQLPRTTSEEPTVQLLISVPKRHLKHAVDRNRVKRQIREAYRHRKTAFALLTTDSNLLRMAFVWLSDTLCSTPDVQSAVERLLKKMGERKTAKAPNETSRWNG